MTKKVIFKISGMHCTSCAMNIDGSLEDTNGIKEATTFYAKSITKVEFDPAIMNEDKILAVIKNTGYTGTLVDQA
jgi:Cu+-exporting ATPase